MQTVKVQTGRLRKALSRRGDQDPILTVENDAGTMRPGAGHAHAQLCATLPRRARRYLHDLKKPPNKVK